MNLNELKLDLIAMDKKSYKDFEKKFELEFKKFDLSENLYNCLEYTHFLKIPIEKVGSPYGFLDTMSYFEINIENSYVFPNTVFSEQLNTYYLDEYVNNLDNEKDRPIWTLNTIRDELNRYKRNLNDQKDYIIWAGCPRTNTDYSYLEIPVLHFNRSKLENRYPHIELQQAWEEHWEDNSYDEIGRKAASSFHTSLNNTINDIQIISSLKYEGNECRGRMLLRQMNLFNSDIDIELKDKISIYDHKRIRKLLETTNENLILVIDTRNFTVSGYKIVESDQIQLDEDDMYISFKGFLSWECRISDNKPIFHFEHLQLKFPIDTTNDIKFFNEQFNLTFNKAHSSDNNISKIVENAKKQKKGTMVVILDTLNAQMEADRLKHTSTLITSTYIAPKNILNFSEIDGAIMIDTDGICHSFGVILDGESTEGDPARGARFNSAQRYLKTKRDNEIPCMIVVVSEDGYIDVLSTYKKTVKDEILV